VETMEIGLGVVRRVAVHPGTKVDLSFLDADTRERVAKAMRLAVERQCTVQLPAS
jgi:hypothetical protein